MHLWNKYHTPGTVEEAAELLKQYAGKARIIAGGTDLLIDMRAAGELQEALVDITAVPDLRRIEIDGDTVTLGAGVTHSQIVDSAVLAERATCIVESCGVVGGPQVRNVATLGGNVAHALPAGDGTTSLVALNAEVEIILNGERQWVPILEMYKGPGQSLLNPTQDILIRMRFKLCGEREASAFKRIMRPQGVALPVLGCAVWVRLDESRTHYEAAHICLAPVSSTPQRVSEVEAALVGQAANESTLETALNVARAVLNPRTSKYRATADYRKEMVDVLLRRTLPLAVQRARTGEAVPEGVGV